MAEQEIEAKLQEKCLAEENLFQMNKEALRDKYKYKPLTFNMIANGSHPDEFYSTKLGEAVNHSSALNWLNCFSYGPTGAKERNMTRFADFCIENGKKPSQVIKMVTEVLGDRNEFAAKLIEQLKKLDEKSVKTDIPKTK